MRCDVCHAALVATERGYLACADCHRFRWVVI